MIESESAIIIYDQWLRDFSNDWRQYVCFNIEICKQSLSLRSNHVLFYLFDITFCRITISFKEKNGHKNKMNKNLSKADLYFDSIVQFL